MTKDEVLRKFIRDSDHIKKLFDLQVKFYSLETAEKIREAIKLVRENPASYVLKPQREGGGNNIFQDDIVPFLENLLSENVNFRNYQLTDYISGIEAENVLINESEVVRTVTTSEIGIYGAWLRHSNGKVLLNKPTGILVRTKANVTREGGVCSGGGVLSAFYVDESV